jgi:FlaA1/EpsC-like NDP-sugar epimerase
MGATKRVWELLIMADRRSAPRALDEMAVDPESWPLFTAVRFGNVLGSRGSVVPTFERQIEQGGPVTITHPEMTRYFMSESEAASLIIQAAALTTGGDAFMLDMGQRIRIDELARRLIRLRGLRPEQDIPIEYTGMRAGEKMHEELIGDGESSSTTSHPHVFRIMSRDTPVRGPIEAEMGELIALAELQQNEEIVRRLRLLVGDHRFVES